MRALPRHTLAGTIPILNTIVTRFPQVLSLNDLRFIDDVTLLLQFPPCPNLHVLSRTSYTVGHPEPPPFVSKWLHMSQDRC